MGETKKRKLLDSFISIIRQPLSIYRNYKINFRQLKQLANVNFTIEFPHEGGTKIILPVLTHKDIFTKKGRALLKNSVKFSERPNSEALLRKIVFNIYQNELIDPNLSIIDIGCWLSDNTLIWSNLINKNSAKIYAIDPSASNIAFGKLLANINNCSNIEWSESVCAEINDLQLYYKNKIEHATFNTEKIGLMHQSKTTTLDIVVGKDNWNSIGMLHVDVEGFEENVLLGAKNIILNSKPLVIFEQHICVENTISLCKSLEAYSYSVFMINEVLPGCDLDCRNFIAIPDGLDISSIVEVEITNGRNEGIWYAVNGNAIVPYKLN